LRYCGRIGCERRIGSKANVAAWQQATGPGKRPSFDGIPDGFRMRAIAIGWRTVQANQDPIRPD
jgi:hypothetical protein